MVVLLAASADPPEVDAGRCDFCDALVPREQLRHTVMSEEDVSACPACRGEEE